MQESEELLKLDKSRLRKAVGLIAGHYSLNAHLHKLRIIKNPTWRSCRENEETSFHVIEESLEGLRETYLKEMQQFLSSISMDEVLDFIGRARLLQG